MNHNFEIITLSNGLKIVFMHRPDALVSYIGLAINAGSRDEGELKQGLAHFVEHTIFKGTQRRKSWQISDRMESVGGELNAYTSKEMTMVFCSAPSGYEERSIELLYDIIANSVFPKDEIDRERDVVTEEIYSYLDSPSESVFDEFEELIYKGSDLSHNILGTPESVKHLDGKDCRDFLDIFYVPKNMVMYCCSPISAAKFTKYLDKYFGKLYHPLGAHRRISPPPVSPFDIVKKNGHHQANTIMGKRIFSRNDPRRFALSLLNNYFGGPGMNSRLNRELREKRGLVYTVESTMGLMSDTGVFIVYFACEEKNVKKCRRIITDQLDEICTKKPSATAFERMKRQYCGQLLLTSDHTEARMMSLAKSLTYYDRINDISERAKRIMDISREEFMDVASLITPGDYSFLTLS